MKIWAFIVEIFVESLWNLSDFQLSWESKMEPECGNFRKFGEEWWWPCLGEEGSNPRSWDWGTKNPYLGLRDQKSLFRKIPLVYIFCKNNIAHFTRLYVNILPHLACTVKIGNFFKRCLLRGHFDFWGILVSLVQSQKMGTKILEKITKEIEYRPYWIKGKLIFHYNRVSRYSNMSCET